MSREVAESIAARGAVVALETAVLTHGLPREPWSALATRFGALGGAPSWIDADAPLNLAAARAMAAAVRDAGAVPAVTAVIGGAACAGLDHAELDRLAHDRAARKVAARDLAPACMSGASGGTTVSASLAICARAGIRVFATGGIGGVHRDWTRRPDVSADLHALSRHPVCVVSSGAKSILDLPATVEAIEALSIPVIGWRCDAWPRFVSPIDPSLPIDARSDDPTHAAAICRTHWAFGGGAVLVVQPVDSAVAVEIASAGADSTRGSATGAAVTPELLGRLVEATNGRSLRANVHLLRANAALAAGIARRLAETT